MARRGRSGADFRRNCVAIVGSCPRRIIARAGRRLSILRARKGPGSGRLLRASGSGKPGDDREERGMMAEAGGTDGPRWYAETTVAAPERAPLVQDADVDVCVIGRGLARLPPAREIVRAGWAVGVLEAQRSPWDASGRSARLRPPGV